MAALPLPATDMNAPDIELFLDYLRHELNRSPHTVAAYRRDLEQYVQFLTADGRREAELATAGLADVRAWLHHRSGEGDCPRTLRRKVQAVRALYNYLLRRGLVGENPAADVELARLPKRLPAYVRSDEMDRVLDEPADLDDATAVRDRLIVMMLYETGLRRAELIALRDSSVDTAKREMRVHGKRDKDRIVPFGPELAQWIDAYRSLRDAAGDRGDTFFTRRHGLPLYPTLVYNVVKHALDGVAATKRSPHVLRHSFATAMLAGGAALDSVKELLGHTSVATTQVYTHVTLSDLINSYKHAHPRALKKGD